jgi:hypothetical protein
VATYQIEIANKIRNGRAVGTDYVVTRRPDGFTSILARFNTRDEAAAWIASIDGLAVQALCRMDTKGESLAEAAEAVTGGDPATMAAVIVDLRGAN